MDRRFTGVLDVFDVGANVKLAPDIIGEVFEVDGRSVTLIINTIKVTIAVDDVITKNRGYFDIDGSYYYYITCYDVTDDGLLYEIQQVLTADDKQLHKQFWGTAPNSRCLIPAPIEEEFNPTVNWVIDDVTEYVYSWK